MTLQERIAEDFKQAMKARKDLEKTTLNYVLAQIKNKKIETQKDPTDDEIIQILKKEIKASQETIILYEKTQSVEMMEEEQKKIAVLSQYLPTMLDEAALKNLITSTMQSLGIADIKTGRGQVTKVLMEQHRSVIDGQMMNQIITSMM